MGLQLRVFACARYRRSGCLAAVAAPQNKHNSRLEVSRTLQPYMVRGAFGVGLLCAPGAVAGVPLRTLRADVLTAATDHVQHNSVCLTRRGPSLPLGILKKVRSTPSRQARGFRARPDSLIVGSFSKRFASQTRLPISCHATLPLGLASSPCPWICLRHCIPHVGYNSLPSVTRRSKPRRHPRSGCR